MQEQGQFRRARERDGDLRGNGSVREGWEKKEKKEKKGRNHHGPHMGCLGEA